MIKESSTGRAEEPSLLPSDSHASEPLETTIANEFLSAGTRFAAQSAGVDSKEDHKTFLDLLRKISDSCGEKAADAAVGRLNESLAEQNSPVRVTAFTKNGKSEAFLERAPGKASNKSNAFVTGVAQGVASAVLLCLLFGFLVIVFCFSFAKGTLQSAVSQSFSTINSQLDRLNKFSDPQQ